LVALNKPENQGMQSMSKKPQSKDEALEALDFIVNVLKEHEKDLDKLINELGTVTETLGETGELTYKVEKVEEKITGLQNEINTLVNYLSTSPRETPLLTSQQQTEVKAEVQAEVMQTSVMHGPPVILRCKQWEDFQTLAFQAQTLSFMYKEAEKTFQADALKGNQIITYSGELPKLTALLKMWLTKQLEIPEKKILEGVLAIG
jgi:tetrahydromethanopterin S-methyltransferase subunit B